MTRARGFSLIEILVALTLFAVVGGTMLQLFQSGLRTARLADAHTHAVFLARSKLSELEAYNHLQAGTLSGSFDDDYRWQAVLSHYAEPDGEQTGGLQPLDLILTVRWGDPGDEREFSLHSLLLTQRVES
jgi:general secretion pathway protein I